MGSFSSSGQQYATTTDLANVVAAAALAHPSTGTAAQNAQLVNASTLIDGYLRDQYQLPLNKWGSDIVQATCDIAAYRLVCLRGFNPERDGHYETNFKAAVKWLEQVAAGKVSPDVVDNSSGSEPGESAPAAAPLSYSPVAINSTGTNTRGAGSR